ncbi:16S rRNA (cytosine(967)-C(5))-methyltransferase RsmB [Alkalibacterium pelagium]|uniref:16S rRNA (cytosine(967)-C(5))-methyltransferase n=1 Tax=Alkalibacterium pelagium TaxID=426702 RepID=A0A1H7GGG7_9LACT|nr:16S rRNA (cytosine(967)-C(5))-methyltransferase RsmB [Alkalibacterium pelagium]GEN49807.1 ribosomal RNA small subunit methyltransferase B [Alkalibacterium pelagium]SEK37221.1 16S rRNA (cytosine967-C5)-methyltransferase [Alkalibacterium pelagium]
MSNKKIKQSSRYLAVEILDKVEASQAFSNIVLNDVLRQNQLSPEDTRFLTELVYGVIQNKLKLDYQLDPFIRKQKKIDGWVMQLLRVSLYQITLLDKVPIHAIVNEAVNIAKIIGNRGISGFVNGVLRAIERKGVRSVDDISDPINKLSIKYSYPEWIVTLLSEEVGMEETEKILDSLSDKARLSLRVNTTLKSVEAVQKQLELEGFETEKSKVSDNGLICLRGLPVHSSLFKDGIITIQDESSMLVAEALQVEAGDAVLDACAAPGGKTTHIATYLDKNKGGQVTALDLHEKKIRKIRENADRLGFADIIITNAMDARKAAETFEHESFDKILIDAPCSGLGLMRRKPDIRYQKKLSDIHALQKVQLEILTSVAPLLKKGGRLVYSTCTITRKENDDVVKAFLSEQPSFEIEPVYRKNTDIKLSDDGFLHLYPHRYHTDGFFIASLRKTQSV